MAQILLVLMSMSFHRACVEFVNSYYTKSWTEEMMAATTKGIIKRYPNLDGYVRLHALLFYPEYIHTPEEYAAMSPDSQSAVDSVSQLCTKQVCSLFVWREAFDPNQCRTFREACIRISAGDTCQVVLDRLDHYWKHHSGRIAEVVVSIMVQRGYDEEYPDTDNIPDDIFDAIWKDAQLSIILQEVYKNCPE
jgi:hypothetical protein